MFVSFILIDRCCFDNLDPGSLLATGVANIFSCLVVYHLGVSLLIFYLFKNF